MSEKYHVSRTSTPCQWVVLYRRFQRTYRTHRQSY